MRKQAKKMSAPKNLLKCEEHKAAEQKNADLATHPPGGSRTHSAFRRLPVTVDSSKAIIPIYGGLFTC
jgi:hypothetical protein